MTAKDFVKEYFQFAVRPGAEIDQATIRTAGAILLQVRVRFLGRPEREAKYFQELCAAVEVQLANAVLPMAN